MTIDWIHLRQDIEYVTGKICEYWILSKLENLTVISRFWLIKYNSELLEDCSNTVSMDHIQKYALTNTFSIRHAKKRSIERQVYHAHEAGQVKMACDFPHLCQFISVNTDK